MGWGPKKKKGERPSRSPFANLRWERLFGRERRRREHVHLDLAARAGAEADHAVDGGEQRVVAAETDILAGVHLGAALADQNIARQDLLAAEALHAQPLAVGIAAVTR